MYMQIEQNIPNETNTMKIHNELKEITKLSFKSPWLWAPYLIPSLLESQILSSTKGEIFIK